MSCLPLPRWGVNKPWREAWIATGAKKVTGVRLATAIKVLRDVAFKDASDRRRGMYRLTADAGNVDGLILVVEVDDLWPKPTIAIAGLVVRKAEKDGHLEVLKWAKPRVVHGMAC